MTGETISLDYTLPTTPGGESDTPFLPGFQLAHLPQQGWCVRKVVRNVTQQDAARGIEPEYRTYPGFYQTQDDALQHAQSFYQQDGPGDVGGDAKLRDWISQHPAGDTPEFTAQSSM